MLGTELFSCWASVLPLSFIPGPNAEMGVSKCCPGWPWICEQSFSTTHKNVEIKDLCYQTIIKNKMTAHIKSLLHYCKHNSNYYAYASTMPPSRKYVEHKTSLLISLNLRKILKDTIFKKLIFLYVMHLCGCCVHVSSWRSEGTALYLLELESQATALSHLIWVLGRRLVFSKSSKTS